MYENFGVKLSQAQINKIIKARKVQAGVKIRLSKNNLSGEHELALTKTQINRLKNSKAGLDLDLSAAQLKYLEKKGGFLPLLALLPLIFGGIGAAGAAAGGVAGIATAVTNSKAQSAAQAESERHNKAIEEQNAAALKSGTGILSNVAGKIPVFGETIKHYLQKLGLGINDCNRIRKGECICIGKGLFLGPVGSGLFLGPKSGDGLFLGPQSGNGLFLGPQSGNGLFLGVNPG